MVGHTLMWNWVAAWAATVVVLWMMLVPATLGLATFVISSGLLLIMGLVGAAIWRGTESPLSARDVLYDEQGQRRP